MNAAEKKALVDLILFELNYQNQGNGKWMRRPAGGALPIEVARAAIGQAIDRVCPEEGASALPGYEIRFDARCHCALCTRAYLNLEWDAIAEAMHASVAECSTTFSQHQRIASSAQPAVLRRDDPQ